jgi:two-component system, LytTR family, sensor kinase
MFKKNAKYYWLCQLSGWGFVALCMIFFAFTFEKSMTGRFFLRVLIMTSCGILFTHILREVIRRSGWLLLPVEKVIGRLVLGVIITSLCHSLFLLSLVNTFNLSESSKKITFTSRLLAATLDNGLFIIPWALIYYFYHYIEKSRKQEIDTLKLETLVKELELKTIKSHINPHFIFNALNSIRALIDENPGRARNAITELSTILRSSMQADKLETVPFEKELNIVKDYLALEHIRFEDRLQIEYDIDEDTLDQPVPPMMLQTLVENAIKHGIGRQVSGGKVKIISDFNGDNHQLIVQNTGRLNGTYNTDGFGLTSTQNRLQLLFGQKANFSIEEINSNTVEARVSIPVENVIA